MVPSPKSTINLVTRQTSIHIRRSCLLSDYYGVKVVFNSNKNNRKPTYTLTILNDTLLKEEIKKEIKDFLEFNENVGTTYPNLWDTRQISTNIKRSN